MSYLVHQSPRVHSPWAGASYLPTWCTRCTMLGRGRRGRAEPRMTSRHSIPELCAERLVNKQGRHGNGGSIAEEPLMRGLLWAALSCANAQPPTQQRDPPQYDGRDRTGRGEWRPADRERARVTTGPYAPKGWHAIGSKDPHGQTFGCHDFRGLGPPPERAVPCEAQSDLHQ